MSKAFWFAGGLIVGVLIGLVGEWMLLGWLAGAFR